MGEEAASLSIQGISKLQCMWTVCENQDLVWGISFLARLAMLPCNGASKSTFVTSTSSWCQSMNQLTLSKKNIIIKQFFFLQIEVNTPVKWNALENGG